MCGLKDGSKHLKLTATDNIAVYMLVCKRENVVLHIDSHGHLPNWQGVEILQKGLNRSLRKTAEAAYISINKTINHREGFVNLSSITSNLIVNSLKTPTTVIPRAPVR